MTPSRRQFITSVAALPLLAQTAGAQSRRPATASDAVLDQILDDLRASAAEFETQPRSRKAAMRAMESALGIGAAHLAAHYDAGLQRALLGRQARSGRAALIQDLVGQAHEAKNHTVKHDAIDAAMTRLEQRGLSGCFRDVQQTIRKVRLQTPEHVQAASAGAAQYDYCSDLFWMISLMEATVAIACGIAVLEPTPGGEIACGALTLALGLLLLQKLIWC
jgi:hypothetical protein